MRKQELPELQIKDLGKGQGGGEATDLLFLKLYVMTGVSWNC